MQKVYFASAVIVLHGSHTKVQGVKGLGSSEGMILADLNITKAPAFILTRDMANWTCVVIFTNVVRKKFM